MVFSPAPTSVELANSWIIINGGGGPTDDKPTVILETPRDPDRVSSFLNIRVKDIEAVYAEWSARGAEFLTPPKQHRYEIRCYIRDPDGHLIEVGQTTDPTGDNGRRSRRRDVARRRIRGHDDLGRGGRRHLLDGSVAEWCWLPDRSPSNTRRARSVRWPRSLRGTTADRQVSCLPVTGHRQRSTLSLWAIVLVWRLWTTNTSR